MSHAGLRVVAEGRELICDPWLVGSTYWRSWWNYPPVPAELVASLKPDFIYVTHLHWDHFHNASLSRFSPDTQVIVPYDRYGRMTRDLKAVGMTNVHELRHGESIELGPKFALTSYHISPLITDSAAVIEAEGVTLFNANDAKFAGAPLQQILKRHRNIDFCFRSHSSANSRACYHTTDSDRPNEIEDDNERYIAAFSIFMAAAKPRYAIPFASNSCLLHDDVFHMNGLIQTPSMVAEYFKRFARERGLDTKLQVMAPGDRWDSESGFAIQENDWFNDRPAKLEAYRARVAPTLERQATREARMTVSRPTVERYFKKLADRVPSLLTAKLKGSEILLIARAGDDRKGFAVDLHGGGKVREVKPAEFHAFDMRIEFPAVILRQALAMNMFQHAGISKRVHYYATAATMPKLKRFVAILDMDEAELFPLRSNISLRAIRALLPRWREGLLYSRVMVDVARGSALPDLEMKYLEELA